MSVRASANQPPPRPLTLRQLRKKSPEERATIIGDYLKHVMKLAVEGCGPFESAEAIAAEYQEDGWTLEQQVSSLINWHSARSFGTGFVTGLGGLLMLPIAVPVALTASWMIQARLVAAITYLHGKPIHNAETEAFTLMAMMGQSVVEPLKRVGIDLGNRLAYSVLQRLPANVLTKVNEQIGIRLIASTTERGMFSLLQFLPFLGGFIGGTIDWVATRNVGWRAHCMLLEI